MPKCPCFLFKYVEFNTNSIHEYLCVFVEEQILRYEAYLVYMVMFQQVDNYKHLIFKKVNEMGASNLVIEWIPSVRLHD